LQGKVISMFHVQGKVSAVRTKLDLWGKRLSRGEMDSFSSLHDFVVTSSKDLDADVLQTVKEHGESLKKGLRKYFPELDDSFAWICNPFIVCVHTLSNNLCFRR
jgi:hypothetical protein